MRAARSRLDLAEASPETVVEEERAVSAETPVPLPFTSPSGAAGVTGDGPRPHP